MREVTYERRVVVFYDVLGWRSHIRRAGNKASDVSLLRRLILKTTRATRIEKGLDLRVSTFSDNVVISQLPGANTPTGARNSLSGSPRRRDQWIPDARGRHNWRPRT